MTFKEIVAIADYKLGCVGTLSIKTPPQRTSDHNKVGKNLWMLSRDGDRPKGSDSQHWITPIPFIPMQG